LPWRALLLALGPLVAACGLGLVGSAPAGDGVDPDGSTPRPAGDASGDGAPGPSPDGDAGADAGLDGDAALGADADADADAGCLAHAPGLVSWWRAEGDLTDHVGSNDGASGTQNGAKAVVFAAGEVGQAFALGAKGYVQVPNATSLQITTAITMEAWIYATTFGGRVVDKITAGGADGYMLDTYQSKLRIIIGASTVSSPATLALGRWIHVAGTWDGATARVYVDGVAVASTPAPTLPSNTLALRIGGDSTGGNRFDGLIDEVAVYDRALSAAEIADIVTHGSAGRCP
jgi:hypothetical protein